MKASHLFSLGVVSVLLLGPLAVSAQYWTFLPPGAGPYVRLDLGVTFPEDGHLTASGPFATRSTVQYDTGFAMDVAAGYAFNPWVAAELEVGWRWNEISHVHGFVLDDTVFSQVPFLVNVGLRYPLPGTPVVPYIGGGVGGAVTMFDTDGFSNRAVTVVGSATDVVFAYQVFAGLRVAFNPWLSVGVDYKYFASGDASYQFESLVCCGPPLHLKFDGVAMHMVTGNVMLKY
jgi:opacity protein-like surface antigen